MLPEKKKEEYQGNTQSRELFLDTSTDEKLTEKMMDIEATDDEDEEPTNNEQE
jgi:hypothetical protein